MNLALRPGYGTGCAWPARTRSGSTSAARRSSPASSRGTGRSSGATSGPTPQDSQDRVLAELDAAIESSCGRRRRRDRLRDPGADRPGGGRVYVATNMPLADVGLRDRMQERFGVPVGLDNDANAAAIGEWRAGAGARRATTS